MMGSKSRLVLSITDNELELFTAGGRQKVT